MFTLLIAKSTLNFIQTSNQLRSTMCLVISKRLWSAMASTVTKRHRPTLTGTKPTRDNFFYWVLNNDKNKNGFTAFLVISSRHWPTLDQCRSKQARTGTVPVPMSRRDRKKRCNTILTAVFYHRKFWIKRYD